MATNPAVVAAHASYHATLADYNAGRATATDVNRAAGRLGRATDSARSGRGGGDMGASGAAGGNYGGGCNEG